jgi:hypothetical protein
MPLRRKRSIPMITVRVSWMLISGFLLAVVAIALDLKNSFHCVVRQPLLHLRMVH